VSDAAEPAAPTEEERTVRPRRRRWPRIVGLLIVIPIAWAALMLFGPLPFAVVVFFALFVDYVVGIPRRAARKVDLRLRRRRQMERAIENGGPSDKPTKRHQSPDPNEAEKRLFHRRMPGLVSGIWPRGRI
jgi:hypothetical protein